MTWGNPPRLKRSKPKPPRRPPVEGLREERHAEVLSQRPPQQKAF